MGGAHGGELRADRRPLRQYPPLIIHRQRRPERSFLPRRLKPRIGRTQLDKAAVLAHAVGEAGVLVAKVEGEACGVGEVWERAVRREAVEQHKAPLRKRFHLSESCDHIPMNPKEKWVVSGAYGGHVAGDGRSRELLRKLLRVDDEVGRRLVVLKHAALRVAVGALHLDRAVAELGRGVAEGHPDTEH